MLRPLVFRFLLAVAVLVEVTHAATAIAQTAKSTKTEATKLKKDADALMDQDKYVDALALYTRVYELTADPALLYNQGRALEAMGEYAEAIDKLERFEHDASPSLRAKVPGLKDLLIDLRGRIATLVVTTNAPNARLLVREKAIGTLTPGKETRLRTRTGTATVEIVAEGYTSFKKDIDLVSGAPIKIDALLAPRKTEPLLVVRSRPSSADIAIDGRAIGRAPLELHLTAGSHTLVAAAEGREKQKIAMILALGDRRELDIELPKTPSITSRWWFWTGLGVVVAGATATVLAFTIERSPTASSFGGTAPVHGP